MKTCVVVLLVAVCGVYAKGSYDRHDSHRRSRISHTKSSVMFPSGTTHRIVSPYTSNNHCPGKPSYVTLTAKSHSWRKEYQLVKSELETALKVPAGQTFGGFKDLKIEKVFNTCLWQKYKFRKETIYAEAKTAGEQMLFHAPSAPHKASEKGLDERFSSFDKGIHGAGLYFSNNPFKSHSYTKDRPDGKRIMMLCRVTLGNVKVHEPAAVIKLAHPPVGFQSVASVDGPSTEYVIYRGEQAYPDYLITYTV